MHIHCENCGAEIPAAHINIQEKLAVCPQCNSEGGEKILEAICQNAQCKRPQVTLYFFESSSTTHH